jgi:RNA polymerase sigma factor (sigma-70 family)
MLTCNSQHPDDMFNAVYEKYRKIDSCNAYMILGDIEESIDISANSFASLWKERNSFPSPETMISFISKCTRNACLNRLRSLERRESLREEILLRYYTPDRVEIMDPFTESRDAALERVIRSLDMKYRECIRLYYFEKKTCHQIAVSLNFSVRNVRYFLEVGKLLIRSSFSSN